MLTLLATRSDVLMIDIQDPCRVVRRQILSCECIFASSLHALIVADSYGIPCLRFVATDRVIGGSPFNTLALRDLVKIRWEHATIVQWLRHWMLQSV